MSIWKSEETKEEQDLDKSLLTRGLIRKKIPGDGACLFRCISEIVHGTQNFHLRIRQQTVRFLETHRQDYEDFLCVEAEELNFKEQDPAELFNLYLNEMAKEKTWGGQLELHAIASCFNFEIWIYEKDNTIIKIESPNPKKRVCLAFSHGNHYDLIYSEATFKRMAYAQSFIYDMINKALELPFRTKQDHVFENIGYTEWLKKLKNEEQKNQRIAQQLDQNEQKIVNLSKLLPPQGKSVRVATKGLFVAPKPTKNAPAKPNRPKKALNTEEEYFPSLGDEKPAAAAPAPVSSAWGQQRNYSEWAKKPPAPVEEPKPKEEEQRESSEDTEASPDLSTSNENNLPENQTSQNQKQTQQNQKQTQRNQNETQQNPEITEENEPEDLSKVNQVVLNPWQTKSFSQILASQKTSDSSSPTLPANQPKSEPTKKETEREEEPIPKHLLYDFPPEEPVEEEFAAPQGRRNQNQRGKRSFDEQESRNNSNNQRASSNYRNNSNNQRESSNYRNNSNNQRESSNYRNNSNNQRESSNYRNNSNNQRKTNSNSYQVRDQPTSSNTQKQPSGPEKVVNLQSLFKRQ